MAEVTEQVTTSETPMDTPMDDTEEGEILEDGEIADEDEDTAPAADSAGPDSQSKRSDHKSSSGDNEKENNREKDNNRDRDSRRRDNKSEDKNRDNKDKDRDRRGDRDREKDRRHDRQSDRTDRSSRERKSSESDRDRERDRKTGANAANDEERRRRERDRKRRHSDEGDRDERLKGQGDDKRKRRDGNWNSEFNNESNNNPTINRNPFDDYERRPFDDFDFRQPPNPQQQPFPPNAGPPAHHNNNNDEDFDFDEEDWDEMLAIMGQSAAAANRPIDNMEKRNMMRAMAEMVRRNLDSDKGRRLRDMRDKRRAGAGNDRQPGPTGTRAPNRPDRPERQSTYKQICKFFLEGKCHKGPDCPYSHEALPPKKKELCKFYLQGFCGKGEGCLFMHREFPCKFFHTNVECYSGDNCRFSHQPLTEETREILRNYLDSGQLPDDPKPDRHKRHNDSAGRRNAHHNDTKASDKGADKGSQNQTNSQTNSETNADNKESPGGDQSSANTTYAPLKPVPKRHALLGDPTNDMKSSHFTWQWQQEMKELEVAYVGNKRNLFCIEKEFAMSAKPATPRMEDDEDEIEEQIRNYYKDTMPDFDETPMMATEDTDLRTRAPPADATVAAGNVSSDELKLIEAAYHDEDLRTFPMRPRSHTNESSNDHSNQILVKTEDMSSMDTDERSQRLSAPSDESAAAQMSSNAAEVPQNLPKVARDLYLRMQNKLLNDSENKLPENWMSDSDDDEDGVMAAALKNVQQSDKSGGNIDISKMISSIRNSSTGTTAATQSPKHEFWQNLLSGIHMTSAGGSPSGNSTPPRTGSDYRDPRLKRLMSPQIDSTPAVKICDPNVKIEYKLLPIKAPDIDYSTYVSIYRIDARLKNDPRLQKYFSKLESSGLESLSRIVPPPLKTPPVTPISFLMSKKRSEKEKSDSANTSKAEKTIKTRPESPTSLPPLPPLTISPSKSAPIAGIIPPSPPPIMSPLELISSRPTFTVSPASESTPNIKVEDIDASIADTTPSPLTIRTVIKSEVNDRFDAIYALNADPPVGL